VLIGLFALLLILTGLSLGLSGETLQYPVVALRADPPPVLTISFRLLAIFFTGSLGSVTFSIKWLIHAAAKGTWHEDRRYWRLLVPLLGGVYACVVLTLWDTGLIGANSAPAQLRPMLSAAGLAFLLGYFSDGVSGLLSNIANSVFGTLDRR
jgi:hypothetical protein